MNIITRIQEFLNENNNSFIDLINEISPNIPITALLSYLNNEISSEAWILFKNIFEYIDNYIFNKNWRKARYIPKGFYQRTLVFRNGEVTFKRRKYILKPEFQVAKKPKTVFLLVGLESYQRLDYDFSLEIISKLGINFSYQDICNMYRNANITKKTIFNFIKRFDIKHLLELMLDEPDTKIKHDGVIYIETDEAYRNAISYQIKKRLKIKKRIRLTVFHTGYKDPKTIRKTMHNVKFLVTMTNEVKKINSKKYWQGIKEFINFTIWQLNKIKIVFFIKENINKYPLNLLLDVTNLKRSYWDKYKNYSSNGKDSEPLKNIVKVYEENLKQFGYRRITKYLKEDYGIVYNAKKVLRIMKENNIQAEYVKRMRRKILIKQNRNKNIIKYPDLVNRNFNDIKERFSILFTDVTYLIWNGKKHYQSTIIDGIY
ncbi:IS3 family transposase [Spiroplasma endosymbiont of Polydrusus pterygomalis]|uniref:IS3 family transposase n=4 Tax=unclassified Spiroplasma TaxID=2637901 RepID=UPI003CCAD818